MIQVNQTFLRFAIIVWIAYLMLPELLRSVIEMLPFPISLLTRAFF